MNQNHLMLLARSYQRVMRKKDWNQMTSQSHWMLLAMSYQRVRKKKNWNQVRSQSHWMLLARSYQRVRRKKEGSPTMSQSHWKCLETSQSHQMRPEKSFQMERKKDWSQTTNQSHRLRHLGMSYQKETRSLILATNRIPQMHPGLNFRMVMKNPFCRRCYCSGPISVGHYSKKLRGDQWTMVSRQELDPEPLPMGAGQSRSQPRGLRQGEECSIQC
mmetsp:Transcript_16218/g.44629  ORF Transcript_16218/g.44629 Transcript_16218/m.44629 type:complete len:216 (-) Transcript_16218:138-785(-)